MRKLDLGQIITVLANIGVIGSIAFLAIELNQNNAFLRNEARYRVMQNRQEFPTELLRDTEVMVAYQKAGIGEELSDIERSRLYWLYFRMYNSVAWEYEQFQQGLLPNWPFDQHRRIIQQDEVSAEAYRDAVAGYREWAPEFYQFLVENSLLPD